MDLLNYDSSDSDSSAALQSGVKRGREGGAAGARADAKAQRTGAACAGGTLPPAPIAPPFSALDSDAQSASASARRAANALFERRVGARLGGGGGGGEASTAAMASGEGWGAREAAAGPAAPLALCAAAQDPARALDVRTLGLLDARARKELGLSDTGQWEAAGRAAGGAGGAGGSAGSGSGSGSGAAQPWGLPVAPVGGILEVSGRQVRNSGWEAAHLEAMAAAAAGSGGGGVGARRPSAAPIAATVWNHATGRAEVSTGSTRAQKGKHQINTLASAAISHNLRAADRAAEASIQAALARQAGGGSGGYR